MFVQMSHKMLISRIAIPDKSNRLAKTTQYTRADNKDTVGDERKASVVLSLTHDGCNRGIQADLKTGIVMLWMKDFFHNLDTSREEGL